MFPTKVGHFSTPRFTSLFHFSYALHVYEQIQLSRFCHILHGTKLALRFSPRARLLRILLVRLLWRLDRTEPHRNWEITPIDHSSGISFIALKNEKKKGNTLNKMLRCVSVNYISRLPLWFRSRIVSLFTLALRFLTIVSPALMFVYLKWNVISELFFLSTLLWVFLSSPDCYAILHGEI